MIDTDALKELLDQHQGIANSITRAEIRDLLSIPSWEDRTLRLIIADLRRNWKPILFSTKTKEGIRAGYYLPSSYQELEAGRNQLKEYIKSECIVLRNFKVYGARYLAGETAPRLF